MSGVAAAASTAPLVAHAVPVLPGSSSAVAQGAWADVSSTRAASIGSALPRSTSLVAQAPSAAAEFWSGLLAGAVQKTVKELALHPLDTAKARLQVAGGGRRVAVAELFAQPYAGLAPALISGAPAASAFFAVKDAVKRGTADLSLGKTETTLLAVVSANVLYWGVKNPSEVLKVRRQAGVVGDDTLAAARSIWREKGLGGFYESALPNYAYSTPVDSIKFLLYESAKTQFSAQRNGGKLSPLEAAVGGALSAAAAQALATPLDVARVRIMTTEGTLGIVETVTTVAAEEGVAALYSGVAPKVVRALASGAIQFSTYEATKEWTVGVLARSFPNL